MTKPIIVVLEDMIERINWLRKEFGAHTEIVWAKTVDQFFEELRLLDRSRLRLILLDHDLGGIIDDNGTDTSLIRSANWPLDPSGKNGGDAVDGLDGWNDIPVIVWSINNVSAPLMVDELKDKGFAAGWIPFLTTHRFMLSSTIAQLVL